MIKRWIVLLLWMALTWGMASGCTLFGSKGAAKTQQGNASNFVTGGTGESNPEGGPGSNTVATITTTITTGNGLGSTTTGDGMGGAAGPGGSASGGSAGHGPLFYFYIIFALAIIAWIAWAAWHSYHRHPSERQPRVVYRTRRSRYSPRRRAA
jgi:hypothetical protein